MGERDGGTPIDDIAYLARSEHRGPTLIALTVRPRSRSELWEMTGVSESTIRRTLSEFEERDWVSRDGYQYEVTQLGAFVASAMAELIDRVETERKLRDVWRLLPDEETGFTIEMCSDATVTVADPEDPSGPITRFCSLIEETERLRFTGLDVAMLDSCKNELCERIVDGMETELINPPRVANYIRSNCPDLFSEALDSGKLRVAERQETGDWTVNQWAKKAVLLGFRLRDMEKQSGGPQGGDWWDKVDSKFADWKKKDWKAAGFRAVPNCIVRKSAYIAPGVVLMPSFVNLGAYVDSGTMVDTWATVGSCAQIGRNVHLSGGVGIGGVLEPMQAGPVIIEV